MLSVSLSSMKKIILILTLSLAITACGQQSNQTKSANGTATLSQGPPTSKGEALMANTDCKTCHKPDVKLVGPSFKDIANKYTLDDTIKLAGKVMNGGSGSWGDVPMIAHPGINEADAKEMIKYILAQK